tara:strand:- start:656 stop:970 length:315 start_codon:yes stop_codon:yes gene_type:complete
MKKIILLIFIFSFLGACQATKDALTLKKKNNSDEFLVEKKNPLVLPPDFGDLPVPENIENIKTNNDTSKNIITLNKEDLSNKKLKKDSELSSIEKSIMENIKKK